MRRMDANHIAGLSTADAVETVVDGDDSIDPAVVRSALEPVTEDGVVSHGAAEEALAETAKVVSTPETRAELATIALEDARETAESVVDVGAVASRLDGFESRVSAIDDGIEALGSDLRALVERDTSEASLFEVGREIRRIRTEANDLHHAADELQVDLEEFGRWLDDPSVRVEELAVDVDAVAESLSGLDETLDAAEEVGESDEGTVSGASETDDPGESWAEAAVGHRVSGLLLADLRAEAADLRTMADRVDVGGTGVTEPTLEDVEAHIDDLEERRDAIGDRLDALGRPAWRERFDDRLAAVDAVLADFEPPVVWGDLQAAIDEARS